jgi:hypothetical protein
MLAVWLQTERLARAARNAGRLRSWRRICERLDLCGRCWRLTRIAGKFIRPRGHAPADAANSNDALCWGCRKIASARAHMLRGSRDGANAYESGFAVVRQARRGIERRAASVASVIPYRAGLALLRVVINATT